MCSAPPHAVLQDGTSDPVEPSVDGVPWVHPAHCGGVLPIGRREKQPKGIVMTLHSTHSAPLLTPAPGGAPAGGPAAVAPVTGPAGTALALLRIGLGLTFLWPFFDKLVGLGYSTPGARSWVSGGSPTSGFLGHADVGPFGAMFRSWSGATALDWLFMLALLGVGVAVLLGVGLRVSAVAGTVLMAAMWLAEWPLARFTDAGEATGSTNPLIDYHVIYALGLIVVAACCAGDRFGLGRRWASMDVVRRFPWLR